MRLETAPTETFVNMNGIEYGDKEENMKRLRIMLTLCSLVFISPVVFAQDATTGSVQGTVRDGANPLEGVRVVAAGTDGVDHGTLTDSNGEYKIAGLAPGRYLMSFTKDGYQERSNKPITVSARLEQHIPMIMVKTGEMAIDMVDPALEAGIMSRTGIVRGYVIDTSSFPNPIEGVQVVAVNAAGIEHETQTDSSGEFEIIKLPPGRYLMSFTKAGYGERLGKAITVTAGGDLYVPMKMSDKATFGGDDNVSSKTTEEEQPASHKHETGSLIWLLIIGLVIVVGVVTIGRRSRRRSE